MIQPVLLWALGMTELIIILAVIILLFGGRKIPELIRGIGRGIREFKDAKNDKKENAQTNNKLNDWIFANTLPVPVLIVFRN